MHWAWLLLVLAAVLAGLAVPVGLAGVGGDLPLLALSAALAAASYGLWSYASERIVADCHPGLDAEDPNAGSSLSEDWHRRGVIGDGAGAEWDDAGDWEDPWAGPWDDPDWPGDTEFSDPGDHANREPWWEHPDHEGEGERWWERMDGRSSASSDASPGSDGWTGDDDGLDEEVAIAYHVLGLDPGADPEAVRRAYRERIKAAHPDQGGSPEAFRRVRRAYEVLRDRVADTGD